MSSVRGYVELPSFLRFNQIAHLDPLREKACGRQSFGAPSGGASTVHRAPCHRKPQRRANVRACALALPVSSTGAF